MSLKAITKRRDLIVDYIKAKSEIRISEAVDMYGVSDETIRKDFAYLEEKGIVKKIHGGAKLVEADVVYPMIMRSTYNYSEKLAIAKKALEFLPLEKSIIGLDVGSTVAVFSSLLSEYRGNTIITNSMAALQNVTNSKNSIFVTGGEYREHDMSFQGVVTEENIKTMAIDITFMGSSGVYNRQGICSTNFFDIGVKKAYTGRSKKVCVLMDSTKFLKSSLVQVAEWSDVDFLITDKGIDDRSYNEIRKLVNLVVAD